MILPFLLSLMIDKLTILEQKNQYFYMLARGNVCLMCVWELCYSWMMSFLVIRAMHFTDSLPSMSYVPQDSIHTLTRNGFCWRWVPPSKIWRRSWLTVKQLSFSPFIFFAKHTDTYLPYNSLFNNKTHV